MALQHAILVSLCEHAGSGYELARRFDRSIGYFWSATHQQIYRTLRSMEVDGWVHVTPVAQQGRPDKKVYTVADAGRDELARWIGEPAPTRSAGTANTVTDQRSRDLAVKLRGVGHCGPDTLSALRAQILELRTERAALLDVYRGYEKSQFPNPAGLSGSALHQYLVLRGGIRAEEGSVDWLDEILAAIGDPT